MTRNLHNAAVLLLAGSLLAACVTTGTGTGATRSGANPATFNWSSRDAVSGTMTGTLTSTGQTFTGEFFQITSETRIDDLGPLWIGWRRPWVDWPYWGAQFGPQFVTHYSGRVVANLEGGDGQHMRCNFRLVRPASGLAGGATGRCQLPDRGGIDVNFPAR